ncbi:MAG: carbon storage regulator CsrA [Microthrixaceae bacterium]
MLILSRRSNQSIVIGGNIVVTVLETSGDQVRLGIKAPREVTVHREEVHREILEENRLAASTAASAAGDSIDFDSLPKPG